MFVGLPSGLEGFVDVLCLPRDARAWPAEGVISEFEVLQHRPGQVRLWPLDPIYRHDDADQGEEAAWQLAKERHPVGSVAMAEVTAIFPGNQEYMIRFSGDAGQPWSHAVLPWAGCPPRTRSTARYRITAHLDTTRRIMATLHDRQDEDSDK